MVRRAPSYLASLAGVPGEIWHPALDGILSSLFYVNLVSFLDETFKFAIPEKTFPPPDKDDLFNRIERLKSLLADPHKCHTLRIRRNEISHQTRVYANWQELDEAINVVEAELQRLGYAGERPVLIYSWD